MKPSRSAINRMEEKGWVYDKVTTTWKQGGLRVDSEQWSSDLKEVIKDMKPKEGDADESKQ